MAKKIVPQTFQDYQFISSPLLSPDGETTAFVVQTMDMEENCYHADVYTISNQGGEPVKVAHTEEVRRFGWTADGKILYSAPRGEAFEKAKEEGKKCTSFFTADPESGEETYLGSAPLACDIPVFLDDGRWLLSSQIILDEGDKSGAGEKAPAWRVIDEMPFWGDGRGFIYKKRNQLYVYTPGEETAQRIVPEDFNVMGMDRYQDKVLYQGVAYTASCAEYRKGVYLYDLTSGETRCLIEPGSFDIVQAVLLNEKEAIVRMVGKDDSAYSEGTFYHMDLETGSYEKISDYELKSEFCSIVGDVMLGLGQPFKAHGEKLYFVTVEDETSAVRSIDRQGRISDKLTSDGVTNFFDIDDKGIVFYGYRGDRLGELYYVDKDGAERELTHFNDFVTEEYDISPRIPINYTGTDGWNIHGWVMPPAGYEPGKKYPAILHIHGGPRGTWGSEFNHEMQVWANAGYFVLFCNPRGSAGRGIAFADLSLGMGGVDYVNFMEFTDECLRKWPDIDEKRLGVAGGSYGGYMVNWLIGHTDRFAAASSQKSISNWVSMDGLSDMGYYANGLQFGGFVEDNAEHLWDISPLKYAGNAVTPTIFLQSEGDYRCPSEQALQMYAVLKRRGVDSKLVLFSGESHALSREGKPQNRLFRMEQILDWMDTHLKDKEESKA